MAPITCKVVDFSMTPIQGIYALLECKHLDGNVFAKYESFSDDGGNIHYWFDCILADKPQELIPKIVDVLHCPRVTLTFYPGLRTAYFPWINIQTDVQLLDQGGHEFILSIRANAASYSLDHAVIPTLLPGNTEMDWEGTPKEQEMVDFDVGPPRSPSPLQLPSPVIKPRRRAPARKSKGRMPKGDTDD
ncbi:hypothetical protein NCS52_01026700 [Fusarium sp. LHS14.1]|nr:hypothetical protein NCS52_01026700 [Fusarium sp. LHS14.1]